MELILGAFVFCAVLFLYLHIQFHLKTSDDLEVYEIDQPSKDKMEEICDLRQPVMFDLEGESDNIIKTTSKKYILENYPVFEVKIRNLNESNPEAELYMPLQMQHAAKLCAEDTASTYFSENNADFLTETGVIKHFQYNDSFLRPNLVSNCYYDIMFGSQGVTTPFRYDLNYRNFFMVTEGEACIKLSPPKSSKYLHETKNYEQLELGSPVNPWSPQPKYSADFSKIKCLEITLRPGKCLYIPAYWWHSFRFNKDTSISCFRYKTYMNNIAVIPHTIMYYLQNQNIDRKVAKPAQQTGAPVLDRSPPHESPEHIQSRNNQPSTNSETADKLADVSTSLTAPVSAPVTASLNEPVGASLDESLGSTVINI
jgi:hypothetical protein